jgi:hypothetical protein
VSGYVHDGFLPRGAIALDVLQAIQTIADDRYSQLQRRIDDMETRRSDNLQWFALGLAAGVILVGVVALIVLAGAMLR